MLVANRSGPEFRSGFLDADEFSETIGNFDVPWKIGANPTGFSARIRRRVFAGSTFGEMRFGSCTGVRDAPEISRTDRGYICVTYMKKGSLTFSQAGKTIQVRRGDLLLWDGATPSMFSNPEPSQFELVWIPMSLVEHRMGPIRHALGQSAACAEGAGLLVSQHLYNLHRMIGDMPAAAQRRVIEASIDLIFTCFSLDAEAADDVPSSQRELLAAAKAEITGAIELGRIAPKTIAETLGVSVRSLQKAFAAAGETFSGQVAHARLDHARKLLSNTNLSLTEIAHLSGYCDLPHMNRSFRRGYGASPSSYRRQI